MGVVHIVLFRSATKKFEYSFKKIDRYNKGHTVKLTSADLGRINNESGQPKFLQIADRIRELIDSGTLSLGDRLPSVNQIITHFSVSRDTAVKAYQELKNRGIVESSPTKAFFVSNVLIHEDLKRILFLTDGLTPYKEKIYFGLIDSLTPGYYIDLISHSDNFDILKSVYEKSRGLGKYSTYLIIPTSAQDHETEYFQFVNPGNLLFLDRRVNAVAHPAVWQDFSLGFYRALREELAVLKKWRRCIFLTKFYTNLIIEEMQDGIERFAREAKMSFVRTRTRFTDREIRGKIAPEHGDLFIILDDHLLSELLAESASLGLVPGRDIGVIMINEGLLYEHLPVPVSVLSADFYAMGAAAADFVMTGHVQQGPVTTRLIVRDSI